MVKRRRGPKKGPVATTSLVVERFGGRGDGIANWDGKPVYIPFAAPGDRLRVRIGDRRGDGYAAEILEVLEPATSRADPVCDHFGTCGSCVGQHLSAAAYAAWKGHMLADALARQRIATVPDDIIRVPDGSRRRVTLSARRTAGGVILGFMARGSHRLVDVRRCAVLIPRLNDLIGPLRECLAGLLAPGEAGAVAVTGLGGAVDVTLTLARPPDLVQRESLARFADDQDLARLAWQHPDDTAAEPVAMRKPMRIQFAGHAVDLPAASFLQAAAEGEAALVDAVLAGLGNAGRIADLYAGCGSFTFPLAARPGARVDAYEGDPAAQRALAAAADRARLGPRLVAHRRDLARQPLRVAELNAFDAVVFDPPRAGAREISTALAAAKVPTVIGVSCNPATFARDARCLIDGGYRLVRVTPVDQFVYAPHIELVGVFKRP